MKRSGFKKRGKPMKRGAPLRKVSDRRSGRPSEVDLFDEIWDERPHRSEVSGIFLTDRPHSRGDHDAMRQWVRQFSHLVPKGTYPSMRLRKDNIVLKTAYEHDLWHNTPKHELLKLHPGWEAIIKRYHEQLAVAQEEVRERILYQQPKRRKSR